MSMLFQFMSMFQFTLTSLMCLVLLGGRVPHTSATPVSSDMKSFSSAVKNGQISGNKEYTVFESLNGPAVITEQFFSGVVFDEHSVVRIYIDGESEASIAFRLFLAHGIGSTAAQENANVPYSTKRIGHNAKDGGLFNTYRVPYQKSVSISVECARAGAFSYAVRGLTHYQIVLGDGLELPANTRLRLYKNEEVALVPYQFLAMVNTSGTAGALFQVTISANSTDFSYLEACLRAKIDGRSGYDFMSSGTEDFFLSASYYNAGLYHDSHAGCTYKNTSSSAMSAYKFFELDPVLFTNSLEFVWRCGEEQSDAQGCPHAFPPSSRNLNPETGELYYEVAPQYANTTVTTYAWVYEYSFD